MTSLPATRTRRSRSGERSAQVSLRQRYTCGHPSAVDLWRRYGARMARNWARDVEVQPLSRVVRMLARSAILLCVAAVVLLGSATVGWVAVEESPSPLFDRLAMLSPPALSDVDQTDALLAIHGPAGHGASGTVQEPGQHLASTAGQACTGSFTADGSVHGARGLGANDGAAILLPEFSSLHQRLSEPEQSLARYKQWLAGSFEAPADGKAARWDC